VVADDFRTLGLTLWLRVQEAHPIESPAWRRSLDTLVRIRNAVSHSDKERIDNFVLKKQLTLMHWKNTRTALDKLAIAMDSAVKSYLLEISTPPTQTQKGADHD